MSFLNRKRLEALALALDELNLELVGFQDAVAVYDKGTHNQLICDYTISSKTIEQELSHG